MKDERMQNIIKSDWSVPILKEVYEDVNNNSMHSTEAISSSYESYITKIPFIRHIILRRRFKRNGRMIMKVFGNNKTFMKETFGKQHFCYTTWYKAWVWFLVYDKMLFSIACSKRGTEVRGYSMDKYITPKRMYKFLKAFSKLIESKS